LDNLFRVEILLTMTVLEDNQFLGKYLMIKILIENILQQDYFEWQIKGNIQIPLSL